VLARGCETSCRVPYPGEVAALNHEARDNAVKRGAFVVKLLAVSRCALFAGAQRAELNNRIAKKNQLGMPHRLQCIFKCIRMLTFSAVRGTTSFRNSNTMRPAFWPPTPISKNTRVRGGASVWEGRSMMSTRVNGVGRNSASTVGEYSTS
jgi:hypothetical protein